jgi:hypothetical protein
MDPDIGTIPVLRLCGRSRNIEEGKCGKAGKDATLHNTTTSAGTSVDV